MKFLNSLELGPDLLNQVDTVGQSLKKSTAFYQRMFLPTRIAERVGELKQQIK